MMLERLVRALTLTAGILLPSMTLVTCTSLDVTARPVAPRISLHDVVQKSFELLKEDQRAEAEHYLRDHYAAMEEHPAYHFLLALVYGANGDLFNGKLRQSSGRFEHLINEFEKDPSVWQQIRDHVPKEVYELPAYLEGKRRLKSSIAFSPKALYAIYGFWNFFDGQYDEAVWAFQHGRPLYAPDADMQGRMLKLAGQMEALALTLGSKRYIRWDDMVGIRSARNVLDPTWIARDAILVPLRRE